MSPRVYSISPTHDFEGNDGSWSTFAIQVGTSPATLRVLPATSGRSVWVVLSQACTADPDPSDFCASSRGQLFDPDKSTTWHNVSDTGGYFYLNFAPQEPLNSLLPPQLNYSAPSIPGLDNLAFGTDADSDAPELTGQLISAYANTFPYLGFIGLSDVNETVVSDTDRFFSVLGAFKHSGQVARAYYGYTAGASYKDDAVYFNLGSLTFGGYDASLGNVDNVLTVPMAQANSDRALTVTARAMSLADGSSTRPVPLGIPVLIDSVVPEIWLPPAGYQALEEQFGLVWNDTVRMYLIDDQQHDDLTSRNVSITFTLAADQSSTDTLDITLPYQALQPNAGWPLLYGLTNNQSTTLRYFPVKRASQDDPDQFYLGRTFLQEAYLATDYDSQEFYVSPVTTRLTGADEDLRAVGGNAGLSKGAIAGIVVGVVAALAIVAALFWWFRNKKRKNQKDRKSAGTSSFGGTTLEIVEQWNDEVSVEPRQEHEEPGQPMRQIQEHYKPMQELSGEELDKFKPELDASGTERGIYDRKELSAGTVRRGSEQSMGTLTPTQRHELPAFNVRRTSDQSRSSVSPLDERTRQHRHTLSSSAGWPSPPSGGRSSPGIARFGSPSPQLSDSHPSPPLSEGMSWFSGPVPMYEVHERHELHGRSRDSPAAPSTPAPEQQRQPTAVAATTTTEPVQESRPEADQDPPEQQGASNT